MKLKKLAIAGICICSLCSFSTAPVQVSGDNYCVNSDNLNINNRFNHSRDYANKEAYIEGFKYCLNHGVFYVNYTEGWSEDSSIAFTAGFRDGAEYLKYLANKSGGNNHTPVEPRKAEDNSRD